MTSSIALSCPNSMASLANLWPAANCTGVLLLHVGVFFLCGHQGPQSGDFLLPKWESICYYLFCFF